jgi:CRISPR-associated endoribonuclease Cas6
MNDLVSLVLELAALMPTYIDNHMGRAVQQFGLDLLAQVDADLAQRIHDLDDLKPFTVSGLMDHQGITYGSIQAGDRRWIRLTGLSAQVSAVLLHYHQISSERLKSAERVTIELDRLPWKLERVHVADHLWAGTNSYQSLIDWHTRAQPADELRLTFFTPTTFRSQTVNFPIPSPTLVMGSLLSRWIAFTSHQLRDLPQEPLDAFIAHHLLIQQYQLQTDLVRGKQGSKEIGFYGQVTYAITRKSDYLAKNQPEMEALLQREHRWLARTVALLAEFAFYSGVGRKTTTGMGMTR